MLTTVQRIRIYGATIILSVIIVAVFFIFSARQRLSDIRTVSEIRTLAYAIEQFKQDHWYYPAGNNIDIRQGVVLSENGFGPGSTVYYRGGIPSPRLATYQGSDNGYAINFKLRKTWPEQGFEARSCTVRELFRIECAR